MEHYKSIGKLNIRITINNDLYTDFINTFLIFDVPEREEIRCKINILFKEKNEMPDIRLDLSAFKKIELKNVIYYYPENLELYYVDGNYFTGMININKQEANWYVYETIEPRTLFHLLILDPISLIAPYYNLLIGHGAVIRENNHAHVIFGHSGVGKSTVSRLISNRFANLDKISDDTFAFEVGDRDIKVIPFNTGEGYLKSDHDINEEVRNLRDKIIIENTEKFYILDGLTTLSDPLMLKNSYFLWRDTSTDPDVCTQIKELNDVDYLRELLESHTSIPSLYTQKKFILWKSISDQSVGFLIRYCELCNVEKFGLFMGWVYDESI
ncbi:hypothetical protein RJP21_05905 [Paenibacillus sp. VCA1]|uniref:hypothetical protein n=1 Tax=Paenibacillus sp. VCA1 TaxID=3039148 RepID=UPI0028725CF9|nr:hypothetical protein [Paenibacillus sp. VCA1]MDR9853134.1 hypothetical protein [Paenibacillus sp. VCA1]